MHVRRRLAASLLACLLLPACATLRPAPNQHWAEVNGHALYYETLGSGEGPPVLLLHGGGSSIHGSFRHQLAVLARHRAIIAIEQVGQGHSPDVPGPLSYAKMTEDTAALLQQLHMPPVDAVGYSDGGILALMLAVRHPELVHRLVISGANISPGGLTDDDLAELRADAPVGNSKASSDDDPPDDAADDEVGGAEDDPPVSEKLRQLWLYSPTPDELNPELLKTIRQRTLVISGDHDAIRLEHTMMIYRALPDAQLMILPDTGHSTFGARATWVNAVLLAFLAEP